MNSGEVPQARFEIQYHDVGMEFWEDYVKMDAEFRAAASGVDGEGRVREVSGFVEQFSGHEAANRIIGEGDISVAWRQIAIGSRAHLYLYSGDDAVGFRRMDFDGAIARNGYLFVRKKFSGEIFNVDCDWARCGEAVAFRHLIKGSYVLARRVGYQPIITVTHNRSGVTGMNWQNKMIPEWEKEIAATNTNETNRILAIFGNRPLHV
jgi:hypothetical protein